MKKRLLLLLSLLLICAVPALASGNSYTSSQSKTVKLKKLANDYVSVSLGEKSGSSQAILQEMYNIGARDFKLHRYTPCPRRGVIKIAGKSVNGTNRNCVEMTYTYNNRDIKAGRCGKPVR